MSARKLALRCLEDISGINNSVVHNQARRLSTRRRRASPEQLTFSRQSIGPSRKATGSHEWLNEASIQGLGVGVKIKGGVETSDTAFRVYVDKKKPLDQVANPAPASVRSAGGQEVITDVVEIGQLRPQEPFKDRLRPLAPGCGVSHVKVDGGTLACVVRSRQPGAERYILSNSHVLANSGLGSRGDVILQPCVRDGGKRKADKIASLHDFVAFDYARDGFPNEVDAALALIDPVVIGYTNAIRAIGLTPSGTSTRLRAGMRVQIVGRSSGHSWGTVEDTNFMAIVPYPDPANLGREIRVAFRKQVLCSRYSDHGDSGALVLSSQGKAVGLHFAGSDSNSVFNRIDLVLDAFDVELDI